jgi:hypothetical protein
MKAATNPQKIDRQDILNLMHYFERKSCREFERGRYGPYRDNNRQRGYPQQSRNSICDEAKAN